MHSIKKTNNNKPKMFQAIAVMIGYIIGVGMFGLPFVVAKAGIWPFLAFILFFGAVQLFQHMIYANMVVVTKTYHRLPGYANLYLGKAGRDIIFAAKMLGNFGALLAYIIISGIFLHQLLGPLLGGSEFFYTTAVFIVGAAIVFFGIGAVARAELLMSALLISVVVFIAWKGFPYIEISNYVNVDWAYLFLPYGATLMALDGNGSIPIVVKLLNKDPKAVRTAVYWGTGLPVIITIAFTFVIVGISGAGTTQDALVGVKLILKDGVILFSLIFGVLTMGTSILLVSEAIKETLWWDFKVPKNLAWAVAVGVPYALFLLGFRDLTNVISFAGGVAGGLSAIMLILMFDRLRRLPGKLKLFRWQPPTALLFIISLLFMAGFFYELVYFMGQL